MAVSPVKKIIKIFLIVALILGLHFLKLLGPLENLIVRGLNPILGSFYSFDSNNLSDRQELIARNQSLEEKIAKLTDESAQVKELSAENAKLREYLNFANSDNRRYVLAKIVARENFLDSSRYDQNIIIDQGSKNGLRPGLAIINSNRMVIGKILEVKDRESRICLLTSDSCKLAVAILNQNRTIGVSQGDLGLTVKVNFVGQTEKINPGDIIITSGLEKDVPAGLVLGTISRIDNKENDIWQNINLEPTADLNNLGIISAVLPE